MPYDENIDLLEAVERETRRLHARTGRLVDALADRAGLDATGFRCLHLLSRQGPMSVRRLAALAGLGTEAAQAVVAGLEGAGLVSRRHHPEGRRDVVQVDAAAHRARIDPALRELREAWHPLAGRGCDDLALIAALLADGRRLSELVLSLGE